MPAVVIGGAQWGDEGKGQITDYLAEGANMVVRYQGGNNAGHTVVVGDATYKLHLIPSGILYSDKTCVLGNGVVIDPEELIGELDGLLARGIAIKNLRISDQAHYILPTHRILDERSEASKGDAKIGTTGRGIGPAYRDKVHRGGIRLGDPADRKRLRELVRQHFDEHASDLAGIEWTVDSVTSFLEKAYTRLAPHICNTPTLINDALDAQGRVLLEGAQGTLLDIDHGTYPFVTSSSPTAGGACIGAGIGPTRIGAVLGVSKAYTTRVGSGPFPTELGDATGEALRKAGHEFGTTTGRPRRCGWLDLVALRFAVRVNGMTHLAITKLDVLDGFGELKLCVGYRSNGGETRDFPSAVTAVAGAVPIYETMPGWSAETTAARRWSELPPEAIAYISRIGDFLHVPVALVSIGAERTASFVRQAIWEGLSR